MGKEFGWKVDMFSERVINEVRMVAGDMDWQGCTAGKDRGRRWVGGRRILGGI